jgi:hypothetical protein
MLKHCPYRLIWHQYRPKDCKGENATGFSSSGQMHISDISWGNAFYLRQVDFKCSRAWNPLKIWVNLKVATSLYWSGLVTARGGPLKKPRFVQPAKQVIWFYEMNKQNSYETCMYASEDQIKNYSMWVCVSFYNVLVLVIFFYLLCFVLFVLCIHKINNTVSFMYMFSCLFCLYCHWMTTLLQLIIIIIITRHGMIHCGV